MKERMKRFLAACLAVITVLSLVPGAAVTASAAETDLDKQLRKSGVFLTQEASNTCTLVSNLMMFRRAAIINGETKWKNFTETKYTKKGYWWPDGMTGSPVDKEKMGLSATKIVLETKLQIKSGASDQTMLEKKKKWLTDYLAIHKEGVVIYDFEYGKIIKEKNGDTYKLGHAVLLTRYDANTDTFYCADPASEAKEIPLKESTLATGYKDYFCRKNTSEYYKKKNKQDLIIAFVDMVWRMDKGCVKYCDHTGSNYAASGYCEKCKYKDAVTVDKSQYYDEYRYTISADAPLYKDTYLNEELREKDTPLSAGTEVTVTEKKTDAKHGREWYGISFSNKTVYTECKNLTKLGAKTSSVVTAPTLPHKDFTQGNSFSLAGTKIEVQGRRLEKVQANLFAVNGDQATLLSKTAVDPKLTPDFKLAITESSTLNKEFTAILKSLSPGTYRYTLTFATVGASLLPPIKGVYVYESENFTVSGKDINAPTFSVKSVAGGKQVTLSGESGATIYYTLNGGKEKVYTAPFAVKETTTVDAYCVKNGVKSAVATKKVAVSTLSAPDITATQQKDRIQIVLSSTDSASIYYQIDGGEQKTYTKPFYVTEACTVSAWAEKAGARDSGVAEAEIEPTLPSAPELKLQSVQRDIPVGSAVSVSWKSDESADSYTVRVEKDGEAYTEETELTENSFSFSASEDGVYSVFVTAENEFGSTDCTAPVSVTAHAPLAVVFADYDGTELQTQSVRYGDDAVKPTRIPSRKGYTFTGWDRSFYNVKTDLTVTAEYEKNSYAVKFYDASGRFLMTQNVLYQEGINSSAAEAKLSCPSGYVFAGWYVQRADEGSGRDIFHIDSDMELIAVSRWENESLPVLIESVAAEQTTDSIRATGYRVSATLKRASELYTDNRVKVIVSLLSKDNRLLATAIQTADLPETGTEEVEIVVSCTTALADRIEVNVCALEGNDRTGGVLAEAGSCVPVNALSNVMSAWMDESALIAAGHSAAESEVEAQTEYRFCENSKTSIVSTSATAPEGYTLESMDNGWSEWSAWSDSAPAAVGGREVETQQVLVSAAHKQYRYGRWTDGVSSHTTFCPKFGSSSAGWGTDYDLWKIQYTGWLDTRYYKVSGKYVCSANHSVHVGEKRDSDGDDYWTIFCSKEGYDGSTAYRKYRWYWEETRTVEATYKTQYRYRDAIENYTYSKWVPSGNWSEWTTEPIAAADGSLSVETRELYRYVVSEPSDESAPKTYEVEDNGLIEVNESNEDMLATVLVYHSNNTDPTEAQLQYAGQTTLGALFDSFRFTPKEELSPEKGDYVITAAIENTDSLVTLGMIKAPRQTYTVTFRDVGGVDISVQEVPEGENAELPLTPEKEGCVFVGWDKTVTNVRGNIVTQPIFVPAPRVAVFVDHLNETCDLVRFTSAASLTVPEGNPAHEGYEFVEWTLSDENGFGDRIYTAQWSVKQFTVSFCDGAGSVIEEQSVRYGEAATPPESVSVEEGMEFLGWSDEETWWRVSSDVTVFPIVQYRETAMLLAETDYCEGFEGRISFYTEEGAKIYYTLDGSDPEPFAAVEEEPVQEPVMLLSSDGEEEADDSLSVTYRYDGEILLTESATVRAIAVMPQQNDSEIVEVSFLQYDEAEGRGYGEDLSEIVTRTVHCGAEDEIALRINLDETLVLENSTLLLQADPTVFTLREITDAVHPDAEVFFTYSEEEMGWFIFYAGDTDPVDGTLLTITLQLGAYAEMGDYTVSLSYDEEDTVCDAPDGAFGECITLAVEGTVVRGDVNGDGDLSNTDAILVLRQIAELVTLDEAQRLAADVNGDGAVNLLDVLAIIANIVGD